MKINGYPIPLKEILIIGGCGLWLGTLQFQVLANGEDIEKQSETKERLVRIEVTQESLKDTVEEIKVEQKEQDKKLDKILEKVSE